MLKDDYRAGTFQAFGELGYRIDAAAATTIEPFANLAYVNLHTGAFSETGGGAMLRGASQTNEATFTTVGVGASHAFNVVGVDVAARGAIGWQHVFGDTVPTSVHAFSGGDAFSISGVPIGKDAARLEAGLDFALTRDATLGLFLCRAVRVRHPGSGGQGQSQRRILTAGVSRPCIRRGCGDRPAIRPVHGVHSFP